MLSRLKSREIKWAVENARISTMLTCTQPSCCFELSWHTAAEQAITNFLSLSMVLIMEPIPTDSTRVSVAQSCF